VSPKHINVQKMFAKRSIFARAHPMELIKSCEKNRRAQFLGDVVTKNKKLALLKRLRMSESRAGREHFRFFAARIKQLCNERKQQIAT
jgi:hypothetical protein